MGPITDAHRLEYANNIALAVQEMRDPLEATFTPNKSVTGKQLCIINLIGETEAREDAAEGGDTPDIDAAHEPVWVRPRRIDWGKVIRLEDQIKALTDFKSEYVQNGAAAIVRKQHAQRGAAFFGARLIGNEVPTSTAWAGSTVAVDLGSTGTPNRMSIAKWLRALRLMTEAFVDVDMEQIYCAMNAQQNEELYSDIEFKSMDYRSSAVLEEKRVTAFLGVPIVQTQRIPAYDGNTYQAAFYCRSAMHYGYPLPRTVKSAPNPAKQYREHPYIEQWHYVTRSEDKKVVRILTKI